MKNGWFRTFAVALSLILVSALSAFAAADRLPTLPPPTTGGFSSSALPDLLDKNEFLVVSREETDPGTCGIGPIVVRVVHHVINDADSAVGGGSWARDTYGRYYTIVQTSPGFFCVVTRYVGSFISDGVKSPGGLVGGLAAGVRGTFTGGYRSNIFAGVLNPSPSEPVAGNLGTFDYGCNPLTDPGDGSTCTGFVSILSVYFLSTSGFDLEWWGWRYVTVDPTTSSRVWQNACDGPDGDCPGTVGDIAN